MYRVLLGGLSSAAFVALALSAGAQEQNGSVERSGNTFHKAVCGMAVGRAARCFAHVVTDSAGAVKVHAEAPVGGLGPSDLRSAYNVTGKGNSSTIIAIIDAYGYPNAAADLKVYRKNFALGGCSKKSGCFAQYNQNGGKNNLPAFNLGWAQESALDLDMASAMCPACKIYLIEANTSSYSNLATAVNTAATLGAHVISNSYGGGEAGTSGYESAYNHSGVAITVSSGDSGYAVQFPASSPHVTAVGGTHLVRDGSLRGWNETAWAGAGSGCSTLYSKPAWQIDAGCSKRTVADVSAVADPATGVAVYGPTNSNQTPGWMVFGGTSVAAPLVGGIYGANGGTVTFGSDPYNNLSALYDVTSGSNGNCGGSYLCTAGVGYDGPTGLGTPNGSLAF